MAARPWNKKPRNKTRLIRYQQRDHDSHENVNEGVRSGEKYPAHDRFRAGASRKRHREHRRWAKNGQQSLVRKSFMQHLPRINQECGRNEKSESSKPQKNFLPKCQSLPSSVHSIAQAPSRAPHPLYHRSASQSKMPCTPGSQIYAALVAQAPLPALFFRFFAVCT